MTSYLPSSIMNSRRISLLLVALVTSAAQYRTSATSTNDKSMLRAYAEEARQLMVRRVIGQNDFRWQPNRGHYLSLHLRGDVFLSERCGVGPSAFTRFFIYFLTSAPFDVIPFIIYCQCRRRPTQRG